MINISNNKLLSLLETLSVAIQSPKNIEIFINSDFFKNLVNLFIKILAKNLQVNQTLELNIIKVFVATADFEVGQNWFANEEGCMVWKKLIYLLCYSNYSNQLNNSEEICSLVIRLIKKMLF